MEIIIKFTNERYRSAKYYLRRRYNSKAGLAKLAKMAILKEVANEAKKELDEAEDVLRVESQENTDVKEY